MSDKKPVQIITVFDDRTAIIELPNMDQKILIKNISSIIEIKKEPPKVLGYEFGKEVISNKGEEIYFSLTGENDGIEIL